MTNISKTAFWLGILTVTTKNGYPYIPNWCWMKGSLCAHNLTQIVPGPIHQVEYHLELIIADAPILMESLSDSWISPWVQQSKEQVNAPVYWKVCTAHKSIAKNEMTKELHTGFKSWWWWWTAHRLMDKDGKSEIPVLDPLASGRGESLVICFFLQWRINLIPKRKIARQYTSTLQELPPSTQG